MAERSKSLSHLKKVKTKKNQSLYLTVSNIEILKTQAEREGLKLAPVVDDAIAFYIRKKLKIKIKWPK